MIRTEARALAELPAGARVVIRLPNGRALADVLLTCFELHLVAVPLHPRATDRAGGGGAAGAGAAPPPAGVGRGPGGVWRAPAGPRGAARGAQEERRGVFG
ncbi:hypothetical protein, partial [Streptomyces decoyicus]